MSLLALYPRSCTPSEECAFSTVQKRVSWKICLLLWFQSEGQVLKEAAYINKSLLFLEQIVIALADPKRDHVPFRQSKLTHVLKDSLGKSC